MSSAGFLASRVAGAVRLASGFAFCVRRGRMPPPRGPRFCSSFGVCAASLPWALPSSAVGAGLD